MCGIAGFVDYPTAVASYIHEVAAIQRHRGPDHQALWQEEGVALCHQRLSIIDLSAAAHQPMIRDHLVIIYNGELYNYRELRARLTKEHDIAFTTESDTEVILAAYRLFGPDCLQLLRGMYALAIYDIRSRQLFLARDPFGIKPLFYFQQQKMLAFASELKTLVRTPGFDRAVSQKGLLAALNYLWLPEQTCMFNQARKLPAGSYLLRQADGAIDIVRYYHLPARQLPASRAEQVDMLDEALRDSVAYHMVADVPVAAFLSGGLDSSLLAVLAAQHNRNISTYSIGITASDKKVEQMPDDARYARQLAERFGFNHHEIVLNPSITDELPRMVYHLDEPIGDPAAINTWLISRAAREQGSKVLLSGMGADELFFGYRRQKATLLANRLPRWANVGLGALAGALPVQIAGRGFKPGRWLQRYATFASQPLPEAYMRSYSYYSRQELGTLLAPDLCRYYDELAAEHRTIFNERYSSDPINQMCYTDIHMFMNGLNLTYTDRASMAASVEVRVPFIDKDTVELAMAIPGKYKYQRGEQKSILKEVATRYLPKEIIYRPKASFGAPIRSWISGPLRDMVQDLLSESQIKKRGIFNYAFIKKMIEDDRQGRKDYAYQIYELLTLELWWRTFVDSDT